MIKVLSSALRLQGISFGAMSVLATLAHADAPVGLPDAVGPSDEILLDAPPVRGLINDGDESLAETVFVYLDGCPLLSVTPPATGRGKPTVSMVDADGDCAPIAGVPGARGAPVGLAGGADRGFHVQLWRDDADPVEVSAGGTAAPRSGNALIIDLSNLYPPEANPIAEMFAGKPIFDIPGIFGDPSSKLVLTSAGGGAGGGNGGPPTLFGPPSFGGGSGGGGGGDRIEPTGGNVPGGGSNPGTGFFAPPKGGDTILTGGGGGNLPPVSAVPIPATLLLLLGALMTLRRYVRRA